MTHFEPDVLLHVALCTVPSHLPISMDRKQSNDDVESFSSFASLPSLSSSEFPQFQIDPDKVTVLYSPIDFHKCLIDIYKSAQKRIVLAALYIGTAPPEEKVIDAVVQSCERVVRSSTHLLSDESSSDERSASTRSSSEVISSKLVVDILIDSARGRREEEDGGSSLTMLQPLFDIKDDQRKYNKQGPLSINVNLFHSPLLSGLLYRLLPTRINEVLGVFHTKVFLVDDTVILTGANLSGSYLTNRQDRYVVIRDSPLLANFMHRLIRLIQRFSFAAELEKESSGELHWWSSRQRDQVRLKNGKTVVLTLQPDVPDPVTAAEEFKTKFGEALAEFLQQHTPPPQTSLSSTTLHVAIQAGFCNPPIHQEQDLLSLLLSSPGHHRIPLWTESMSQLIPWVKSSTTSSSSSITSPLLPFSAGITPLGSSLGRIILASGYLNMADDLLHQLTRAAKSTDAEKSGEKNSILEVFMAAPEANSFHQSQGLSKYIPMAYSYIGATQLIRLRQLWEERDNNSSGRLSRWLYGGSVAQQNDGRPKFWEYDRSAWTFHSKGVWFYPRGGDNPTATIVGSSNFGLRSRIRDLDVSFLIQTRDLRLQQQFHKEVDVMRAHSREVGDVSMLVTRCPHWLRFLLRWAGLKTLL